MAAMKARAPRSSMTAIEPPCYPHRPIGGARTIEQRLLLIPVKTCKDTPR
jgi:hypothetical protein